MPKTSKTQYKANASERGRDSETSGRDSTLRGERPTTRRDPSERRTDKPKTSLHAGDNAILRTCADVCNETLNYCLSEGHNDPQHILCLVDAAEICNTVAGFIARDSANAEMLKQCAADIVKAAEESCEEFEDDERMVACADTCREAYEHLVA